MPTIKNVGQHADDLHDGRPIERFATASVTDDELQLDHYQSRIAGGMFVVASEPDDEPAKPRGRRPKDAAAEADTQENDR